MRASKLVNLPSFKFDPVFKHACAVVDRSSHDLQPFFLDAQSRFCHDNLENTEEARLRVRSIRSPLEFHHLAGKMLCFIFRLWPSAGVKTHGQAIDVDQIHHVDAKILVLFAISR